MSEAEGDHRDCGGGMLILMTWQALCAKCGPPTGTTVAGVGDLGRSKEVPILAAGNFITEVFCSVYVHIL